MRNGRGFMGKVKLGKFLIDAAEIERQHAEAASRGRIFGAIEPQAKSVSYDRKQDRLVIELKNGVTFIVPCNLVQGIADARPDEIAQVELGPRGAALHWAMLNQDFSVAG